MKKYILMGMLLGLVACDEAPSADKQQANVQEAIAVQAIAQVGMPGVTNFTEKKLLRKLYELRDQNIATFSYMPDMTGRLWHLCDSIGYGLPYGTQFTNPMRPLKNMETQMQGNVTIPQPEPNGLFMPSTAEGTWIMCVDSKKKGDFEPVYVEPRVVVSPFRLNAVGEYQSR